MKNWTKYIQEVERPLSMVSPNRTKCYKNGSKNMKAISVRTESSCLLMSVTRESQNKDPSSKRLLIFITFTLQLSASQRTSNPQLARYSKISKDSTISAQLTKKTSKSMFLRLLISDFSLQPATLNLISSLMISLEFKYSGHQILIK
jgi:hypothetical protein